MIRQAVQELSREQCVRLLENVGIQCFDDESVDMLHEAVDANINDGTISIQDVEDVS
jgi:hypothetical protein